MTVSYTMRRENDMICKNRYNIVSLYEISAEKSQGKKKEHEVRLPPLKLI